MSITQGLREYDQYKELWNLYERLVVNVPREGERAIYFPQGHIEQLEFSTKPEFHHGIDLFNLPSQILCRVINIQLLDQWGWSEWLSQKLMKSTLMLLCFDTDPTIPDLAPPEIEKHEMQSFFKMLMASATSTHGVPARQHVPIPSSEISSQSMHLGVLATASHAVMTGNMFVVYYKQRASQFVIRLNKYLEAVNNNNIDIGMRFKMRFQIEDSLEIISFFGTVVGIGDFSQEWPDSKWRSLKVQWEEPSTISRPDMVSPWEIEPFAVSSDPTTIKSKRFNPIRIPSSTMLSNNGSRMQGDGIWPTSPLLNESSSFLSKPGKNKAGLNDSSSFLSELEKDRATTSALVRFCSWLCCCFK